jgi:hypothetical protein
VPIEIFLLNKQKTTIIKFATVKISATGGYMKKAKQNCLAFG